MEPELLETIEAGLSGDQRRSISPPHFRPIMVPNWRANTPPPIPSGKTSIPRNKSSPSLMDASPKQEAPRAESPRTMSPTHSRAPPAATRNTIHCHSELTPVTRNTGFCEEEPYHVVVSPDDGTLQGEHLTLPSGPDFATATTSSLQRRPLALDHHIRTKSAGNLSSIMHPNSLMTNTSTTTPATIAEEDLKPVPLLHKFYSFNSRHCYHSQQKQGSHLTPYQPDREKEGNTVGVTPDAAGNIFIPRSIPLDERQLSIPSIRLANHLTGGSTTTLTDEEDTLGDDASWSSRGSSLYLPDEENNEDPLPKRKKDQLALDWLLNLQQDGLHEAASSRFLTGGLVTSLGGSQ